MPITKNPVLNAAIAYSQMLHWKVFPIHYKSKIPITEHGFKDATDNIDQIKKWWEEHPDGGIGLPTGKINNLVVMDIDPRNGGNISLERLIDENEELPHTVECLTGGGGNHFYFKYDERISKSKLQGYEGIDIQGNGKYVVLPTSTHPNGNNYEWELSSKPVITPIAYMPDWLLKLLQTEYRIKFKTKPSEEYLDILKGVTNGGRNNSMMSLIGYLLGKKIDYRIAYELVMLWNERNEPPLEADTVTTAFNNMLKKEAAKRRG
ncbi:hypothetical protein GCM10011409_20080 [Lentibacillus populi]|uniref:DNA primase n=1 Tax=Lentibacillus populi TaxID=1827502 RepID=A0A9W5X5C3_9BACI|nr:hypothetical protein GCM10011409_20080 [Lentibacillus populi]